MSLKILHIKDSHFRIGLKAPISRDQKEFEEDTESKISQIEDICKKEGINFITISGDVLDVKHEKAYTFKVKDKIYNRLNKLRKSTLDKKIYTIAGNHDLPYSSRDFKNLSMYGWLVRSKVLTDIHGKNIVFKKEKVTLQGVDYNKSLTDLNKEIKEIDSNLDSKLTNLLLFHEHLLPHKDFNSNPFLGSKMSYKRVLKEYKNINIFLCGHYHKGYEPYEESNRHIINGWSLFRMARDYYVVNSQHIPEVNIITINKGDIKVERRELKVRDFNKAIITEKLEKELEGVLDVKKFIEKVEDLKLDQEVKLDSLTSTQEKLLESILEEIRAN
jgi:DNA repair exonuclease SbcCD nuclease subunit